MQKATGAYEIVFASGKNYVGKGGFGRAIDSAFEHARDNKDKVISICWKKSENNRIAFIDEFIMQTKRGVNNSTTYNLRWSPGRRYCGY